MAWKKLVQKAHDSRANELNVNLTTQSFCSPVADWRLLTGGRAAFGPIVTIWASNRGGIWIGWIRQVMADLRTTNGQESDNPRTSKLETA